MTAPILLQATHHDGSALSALFDPDHGMNLRSFKKNSIEMIESSQGNVIGPHFDVRAPHWYPEQKEDPFPNGIARQVPWKAEMRAPNTISAILDSQEKVQEQPLSKLEGQKFTMRQHIELTSEGLKIDLSVVSETDSLVGIDYSWHLPQGTSATIQSCVNSRCLLGNQPAKTSDLWPLNEREEVHLVLDHSFNTTFYPFPDVLQGHIRLKTTLYTLNLKYHSSSQENCWRLVYDKDQSYVRIQPLSAQDPFHPNLSVSQLTIYLSPESS